MKKLSSMQTNIVNCLADAQYHSGNDLGEMLKVSRTTIWKKIKQLNDLGLPIQRIPHRGYRLNSRMTLLDENSIRQQLTAHHFNQPIDIQLYASLDSTNRLLRDFACSTAISVCCAETQTEGRGRFGRHWHSPFGDNIYCSSRWHFDCDLSRLSGLSLVVSLAVLATLNQFGIHQHLCVKWPNDILWHNKKLCGSLIEVIAESNSSADVIIGIGLNVNSVTTDHPSLDKPWCSLHDITEHYTDRNLLVANLIVHLNQFLNDFMREGFSTFITKWHQVDYLQDQMITVSQPTGHLRGSANGVNALGQLILIDEKGTVHYLSSGDTSLHC